MLVVGGMVSGGVAANGVVWSVIQLIFVLGGGQRQLSEQGLLLPVAIAAIPLGVLCSIYGLSEGARLRERGRRLQARDARTSLDWRKEEPVLLLRSFEDEQIPDPRPIDFWQRRYEESLARVLSQVGPVVAIGRPEDDLSFGGAARLFVADGDWRRAVEYDEPLQSGRDHRWAWRRIVVGNRGGFECAASGTFALLLSVCGQAA